MHAKAAVHGFVSSVHACEGMMREREPQRLEDSIPQILLGTSARSDAAHTADAPGPIHPWNGSSQASGHCWSYRLPAPEMTLYDTIF